MEGDGVRGVRGIVDWNEMDDLRSNWEEESIVRLFALDSQSNNSAVRDY